MPWLLPQIKIKVLEMPCSERISATSSMETDAAQPMSQPSLCQGACHSQASHLSPMIKPIPQDLEASAYIPRS